MRAASVAIIACLLAVGCGSVPVDRHVTGLAQAQIGSSGYCRETDMAVLWPAYHDNVPLYACSGRSRGWCVLVSPGKTSVVDVTAFMYRTLHRADADWATRPACLRWRGVERFRPAGGDPEVAALPARLNRR